VAVLTIFFVLPEFALRAQEIYDGLSAGLKVTLVLAVVAVPVLAYLAGRNRQDR